MNKPSQNTATPSFVAALVGFQEYLYEDRVV